MFLLPSHLSCYESLPNDKGMIVFYFIRDFGTHNYSEPALNFIAYILLVWTETTAQKKARHNTVGFTSRHGSGTLNTLHSFSPIHILCRQILQRLGKRGHGPFPVLQH